MRSWSEMPAPAGGTSEPRGSASACSAKERGGTRCSSNNSFKMTGSERGGRTSEKREWMLRLKGTFIDVSGPPEDCPSPRALSDPGSERDQCSSFFDPQRQYVSDLSEHFSQGWRATSHGDQSARTQEEPMPEVIESDDGMSANDFKPSINEPVCSLGGPASLVSQTSSPLDVDCSNIMTIGLGAGAASMQGLGTNKRMSQRELRTHIKHATREVEKNLHQRRQREVLSAIQELPEQVGDVLQKGAISLVDDVMEEVAVVRDIIQGHSPDDKLTCVTRAVEKLDVIPEMIQDSFEVYFARAERTVRKHVDNMIQGLEGRDLANEQVQKEMWAIPAEVQEITMEAMQAAVQESRAQAQQQIDFALKSLPESDVLRTAEEKIVAQVPTLSNNMIQAAKDAASDTVNHAMAIAQNDGAMMKVANQVVAEALLRAKVGTHIENAPPGSRPGNSPRNSPRNSPELKHVEALQLGSHTVRQQLSVHSSPLAPSQPPSTVLAQPITDANEGSIGHPELCARPCLYFAKGECANGQECHFCHLPHPRRPVHPDKKNRQLLKEMSFEECLTVIFPVLKEKVATLGLGSDATRMITVFSTSMGAPPQLNTPETPVAGRRKKQLQEFLRSMSLRSVMALLMRAAPLPAQRDALEKLTTSLRSETETGRARLQ
mmetsp:Transcript_69910/g.158667  ORF Transcript_69910/g.158667 Transcript_69910/m.158667 type:complete len:661 (+) Transcript_69910:40-2022(+)